MVSVVPNPLDLNDPALITENWEVFKKQWKNYLILAEAGALGGTRLSTPKLKMAMFSSVIGRDGLRLMERVIDLNESTLDQVIDALDKYFWALRIPCMNDLFLMVLFKSQMNLLKTS
jgi:hypothetical protein